MRFHPLIMAMAISPVASFVSHQPSNTFLESQQLSMSDGDWQGEIVPNQGGMIRGCSILQVGDSITDWEMTIDGIEADLGRFSEAIYKKILSDAKQQRFQGFRPGTISPHLFPTYVAFTMDECTRETVMEAMEQNNIRPFTDARNDLFIENISIPPPVKKGKKKKNNKRRKGAVPQEEQPFEVEPEEPKWTTYETMKEAINAGWKPGQSFSFVAKNVKGQKVLSDNDAKGARPLGLNY